MFVGFFTLCFLWPFVDGNYGEDDCSAVVYVKFSVLNKEGVELHSGEIGRAHV